MPRSEFIEKVYYTYPELSERAKEAVRNKYNTFLWEDGEMHERMQAIADGVLAAHGFSPAVKLEYDLYCRGGEPKYSTDGELTSNGEEWQIRIRNEGYRGMTVEVYQTSDEGEDTELYLLDVLTTKDAIRVREDILNQLGAINREIYNAFIAEDEYMSSDEVVAEASEANGWEYTEEGELI